MARGKMDQELLALSRASKHIEDLDDPRAQSRVATYLMMRYTAAGEQNLPSEERNKHFAIGIGDDPEAPDPRQLVIPGTVPGPVPVAAPVAAPTRPATAPDTRPATTPATPPDAGAGPPAVAAEPGSDAGPGPDVTPTRDTARRRFLKRASDAGTPASGILAAGPLVEESDDEEVEVEI